MNADGLRRLLSDREIAGLARASRVADAESAFRAVLDRLTDTERLFAFTRDQRDRIARRAARLSRFDAPVPLSVRAALHGRGWRARAAGAFALLKAGRATRSTGSLAASRADGVSGRFDGLDGITASRALATAIREVGSGPVMEAQARVKGAALAALRHEEGGAHVWRKALSPLLGVFARNAQDTGKDRTEAALEALAAAAVLTGHALQGSEDDLPFLLGSAARSILREEREIGPETRAIRRLASDLVERNDVRQALWDALDGEGTRLLGASAVSAVFGKGMHARVAAPARRFPFDAAMLAEAWRERFAHMAAADAAAELARMAADPRMSEDDRAVAEFAAEAASAHPGAADVSFAEALDMETPDLRRDSMRPGRLFRAAPRGRQPARVLCRGKHGRLIRCRAAADARGALVGYLAFDPLSREFGGRPLFAAYGLDGKRQGYAWADEPAYWRAGRPEQGFTSVPDSIPI